MALATHRNTEEAARTLGVSAPTLYRWRKLPGVEEAVRAARRAQAEQARARLQKAAVAAVAILQRVMCDPTAPRAARLRAADLTFSCLKEAGSVEEAGARLARLTKAAVEPSVRRRGAGRKPAALKTRPAGHGSNYRHRQEEAITALLTHRNVEEAARSMDISPSTLYRWLRNPEFQAAYREARVAAFAQAGARLAQAAGTAATTILNILVEPGSSHADQVRAAGLVLKHAGGTTGEDIEKWLGELRGAGGDPRGPATEQFAGGLSDAA